MDRIETEGATVEEAVQAALRQLGRREDEVDVEVLDKGSKGVLGFGRKTARVVVRLKEGGVLPPEAIGRASRFLVEIVRRMGMDVEVEAKHMGNELYLEVDQGAGGILIGRHGQTLAALSYLMERVVNNAEGVRVKVFVDVAGYLERRRRTLVTLANERAEEARSTGREIELDPMTAFERKVIHTALHHDPHVRTFSRGEGEDRRVIIAPGADGGDARAAEPRGGDRRDGGGRDRSEGGGDRRGGGSGGRRRRGGRGGRGFGGGQGQGPGEGGGRERAPERAAPAPQPGSFEDPGPLPDDYDPGGGGGGGGRRGRRGGRRRRGPRGGGGGPAEG